MSSRQSAPPTPKPSRCIQDDRAARTLLGALGRQGACDQLIELFGCDVDITPLFNGGYRTTSHMCGPSCDVCEFPSSTPTISPSFAPTTPQPSSAPSVSPTECLDAVHNDCVLAAGNSIFCQVQSIFDACPRSCGRCDPTFPPTIAPTVNPYCQDLDSEFCEAALEEPKNCALEDYHAQCPFSCNNCPTQCLQVYMYPDVVDNSGTTLELTVNEDTFRVDGPVDPLLRAWGFLDCIYLNATDCATITVFDENGLPNGYSVWLEGQMIYEGGDFNFVEQLQVQGFELLESGGCQLLAHCLTVEVTPDNQPEHIDVAITINGDLAFQLTAEETFTTKFGQLDCLWITSNDCVKVQVADNPFGNGICCENGEGTYEILIDGAVVYQSSGDYGWGESVKIQYGQVLSEGALCQISGADCLGLQLRTDNHPSEVSYAIYLDGNDTAALQGSGAGQIPFYELTLECLAVSTGTCVEIVIQDVYGDGFCCTYDISGNIADEVGFIQILWNGVELLNPADDADIGFERTYFLLDGVLTTDCTAAVETNSVEVIEGTTVDLSTLLNLFG